VSAAPVLVLAHAGHWLVSLSYFVPVIAFLGWLGWITFRDRVLRKGGNGDD